MSVKRGDKYPRLAGRASLHRLEKPFLYDRIADELYELNEQGFRALLSCDGATPASQIGLEPEFLETCLEEKLLSLEPRPNQRLIQVGRGPVPSLRYLEAQITWRCNLSCNHCYLGAARKVDMPTDDFARLLDEFQAMGGLRVLISGGEPLCHPDWPGINAVLADCRTRRVLLTNGTVLDKACVLSLNVDEVQISLDGLQQGHEALRGPGSFEKAMNAARLVTESGLDLSIATMVHSRNLSEFTGMAGLMRELGVKEWGIDAPCTEGRLNGRGEFAVSPQAAAKAMSHAFGGAYHGGKEGAICGRHLCTVSPEGKIAQCGFYFDRAWGGLSEGLRACWSRRRDLMINQVAGCAACEFAGDCGGGCRFRAGGKDRPDKVMCNLYGVED